ncbi:UDP-N-acetylmuramoyl-L-alanyl-D-glutamate--2,6-diaminopimelate ligase [Ruminococcaceae bacterium OttesenSCG-928-D13]|nr:UDP-N-acetylmuramoyl-L-alanyl-D-glutamate--2,6-diaminopimelate ligase [Ruminococcaceae bacterium OttesenSCG-928-D13]
MEYKDLLAGIEYTGAAPAGRPTRVVQDSRKVVPGTVFVCIAGRGFDGHDFAENALAAGAGMVVSQRPLGLPGEVTVADTRAAYAEMSQNFFGRPAEKLSLVAVTGTNGKTTVSSVLKQVLEGMGHKCGLIGTVASEIGDVEIPAKFTTPEAWDLAALMSRMVNAGCTHCVMEASSQALAQGRLHGLRFALGIFTNLSLDHLDYHETMEAYFEAKRGLFFRCGAMLCNLDDEYGRRLLGDAALGGPGGAVKTVRSFSVASDAADFTARGTDLRANGVRFGFLGEGFLERVTFPIPGDYSVANALCAGAAAVMLGGPPGRVAEALSASRGVRGRCEVLHSENYTVIRDFAHTGEAMDKLLGSLRPFVQNRMVVLFGCAGEREPTKRLDMGAAAARYGDLVYLAADNPRREDILKTMTDAEPPLAASGKPYVMEPDREIATRMALDALQTGDMLVLCSKGHEDYQAMDGYTLYFDERQILLEWQASKGVNS